MTQIDWSQFLPSIVSELIATLILAVGGIAIAYFRSSKFKIWLNKLFAYFVYIFKWFVVEKWYFSLPFCIVIAFGIIVFRLYSDWKITAFSFAFYIIGLLGWGLSKIHQIIFMSKKKVTNIARTKFISIPLRPGFGNSYLKDRYIDPPIGDVVLGGAQFQLKQDALIFDTNDPKRDYQPFDYGGYQVELQLSETVNRVKSAYFLINSGNSKIIYANRSMGKIRLVFKDAPSIDVELILGKNIREWCPGNVGDYVRETSSPETVTNVWGGMSKNGANAVIDCLKIPVYEFMKDCYLEKITFVHNFVPQSPDTMKVHYSVFGISLEVE